MSATERILKGVRDVLRLQDKVKDLTVAVTKLDAALSKQADHLHDVDRRLSRIEGMIEMAQSRNGPDRLPPGNDGA